MKHQSYILEGEIETTIDKATLQNMVKNMLETTLPEKDKDRISYFLTGNLLESPRGITAILLMNNKEFIDTSIPVGTQVVIKEHGYKGIVESYNPFVLHFAYVVRYKEGDETFTNDFNADQLTLQ